MAVEQRVTLTSVSYFSCHHLQMLANSGYLLHTQWSDGQSISSRPCAYLVHAMIAQIEHFQLEWSTCTRLIEIDRPCDTHELYLSNGIEHVVKVSFHLDQREQRSFLSRSSIEWIAPYGSIPVWEEHSRRWKQLIGIHSMRRSAHTRSKFPRHRSIRNLDEQKWKITTSPSSSLVLFCIHRMTFFTQESQGASLKCNIQRRALRRQSVETWTQSRDEKSDGPKLFLLISGSGLRVKFEL